MSQYVQEKDIIVAKGEKFSITLDDANFYSGWLMNKKDLFPELSTEEQVEVIKAMTVDLCAAQDAKKLQLDKNEMVSNKIELIKSHIYKRAYVEYIVAQDIEEEKIKNEYDRLVEKAKGGSIYQVYHILFDSEEQAKKANKDITKNNFFDNVKTYSIDVSTKDKKGDLGQVLEPDLIPELREELPNVPLDKPSKPIKSRYGWHIFLITDKKEAVPSKYEDVKENLKQKMLKEKVDTYLDEVLDVEKMKFTPVSMKSETEQKIQDKKNKTTNNNSKK